MSERAPRIGVFGWGIVAPRSPDVGAFERNLERAGSWLEPFDGFGPDNFLVGRPDFERFARKPDQFVRAANREEAAARDEIEKIIKTRDRDDWYERLVKADVCVGKVYDVEEMVSDPQINHRQMIVDVEHPTHGRVRQFGVAIKLSETPGSVRSAAPLSGVASPPALLLKGTV